MGYREYGGGPWNHGPNDVVIGDVDGSGRGTMIAVWDKTNEDIGNDTEFTSATLAKVAWDPGTAKWPRWTNFVTTTSGSALKRLQSPTARSCGG